MSRYQKGKTNLDFTEARDSEWQWRQLGHMQVCILLQTDNHASTPLLSFLQAGCPSCRPTNSVKALEEQTSCLAKTDCYCVHVSVTVLLKLIAADHADTLLETTRVLGNLTRERDVRDFVVKHRSTSSIDST